MIYLNKKDQNIYNKRPGAYAIIENDKNEIAIVKDDDNDLYYFGGGLEEGEYFFESKTIKSHAKHRKEYKYI